MSVVEAWTPCGAGSINGIGYEPIATVHCDSPAVMDALRMMACAAVRCSSGRIQEIDGSWRPHGDPMEAALDAFARRVGNESSGDAGGIERVKFPFDTRRRRMSVVVGNRILVKGAPDAVFPVCESVDRAPETLERLARRGLRVLAIAYRDIAPGQPLPSCAAEAEKGLRLLGLVALEDPPRPGVEQVLNRCRRAGIHVAMVTGDHPETAGAIAREIGLLSEGGSVLVGADLPRDLDRLGELLDRDGMVVARVTPEDKLRIAQALRVRGHVVAMTGDGVNDAPALREAAIGVAMGKSGTDVAREAADVVLLDDNFETIVTAVAQGRSTFANIRRFLTYHLADNVAELAPFVVWALTAGRFPLAIGVLQVLALDIGTDVFPALALGAEPPDKRALDGPPVRGHLLDRSLMMRAFAVLGLVEAALALTAFVVSLHAQGWRLGQEPSVVGGIWRGIHCHRPGPSRQRVRLPQRRTPGMGYKPAHQSPADRGDPSRARPAVGVALCAARRAPARTLRAIDRGLRRRGHDHSSRSIGGRAPEALPKPSHQGLPALAHPAGCGTG